MLYLNFVGDYNYLVFDKNLTLTNVVFEFEDIRAGAK